METKTIAESLMQRFLKATRSYCDDVTSSFLISSNLVAIGLMEMLMSTHNISYINVPEATELIVSAMMGRFAKSKILSSHYLKKDT